MSNNSDEVCCTAKDCCDDISLQDINIYDDIGNVCDHIKCLEYQETISILKGHDNIFKAEFRKKQLEIEDLKKEKETKHQEQLDLLQEISKNIKDIIDDDLAINLEYNKKIAQSETELKELKNNGEELHMKYRLQLVDLRKQIHQKIYIDDKISYQSSDSDN